MEVVMTKEYLEASSPMRFLEKAGKVHRVSPSVDGFKRKRRRRCVAQASLYTFMRVRGSDPSLVRASDPSLGSEPRIRASDLPTLACTLPCLTFTIHVCTVVSGSANDDLFGRLEADGDSVLGASLSLIHFS